jgi:hypothetical protein
VSGFDLRPDQNAHTVSAGTRQAMSPSTPFVDWETGTLDTDRIILEAIPLAKLIGLFVGIALVPLAVVFLLGAQSVVGVLFTLAAQFVLAVGASIVLIYVVARGTQLAGE